MSLIVYTFRERRDPLRLQEGLERVAVERVRLVAVIGPLDGDERSDHLAHRHTIMRSSYDPVAALTASPSASGAQNGKQTDG